MKQACKPFINLCTWKECFAVFYNAGSAETGRIVAPTRDLRYVRHFTLDVQRAWF